MKILFTKTLDRKYVHDKLGSEFHVDFIDTSKTQPIKTKSFNLKNNSLIFDCPKSVDSFFKNGFTPNEDFSSSNFNKIFAIGIETKKELRKHQFGTFRLFKNPEEFSHFLYKNTLADKFIYFGESTNLSPIEEILKQHNVSFKKISLYKSISLNPEVEKHYQSVVFFSPNDVLSLSKNSQWLNLKIFSFNHETTTELKKVLSQKIITCTKNSLDDLLGLIKNECENRIEIR